MNSLPNFRYAPLPPNASPQKVTRVIDLLPDQETSSPIKCNIQLVSLQQNSTYDALSYCWGNATEKVPIICNGAQFEVTTNLHSALRQIRDSSRIRRIWVDAICINQSPKAVEERTQQVQLMRDIYMNAKQVIVWLGEAHSDSHLAISLLKNIFKAREKLDEIGSLPPSSLRFTSEVLANLGLPCDKTEGRKNKSWVSLRPLLGRDWFRRIWTVQEAALAATATVLCGKDEIAWDEFVTAIEVGISSGVMVDQRAVDADTVEFLEAAQAAHLQFNRSINSSPRYRVYNFDGFLNHLLWFRRRDAKDPRDKVFALYGLTDFEVECMNLRADYTMDLLRVYKKVTLASLEVSRKLDILSVPRSETQLTQQLPSWVADWSDFSNNTMSLVGQTRHYYAASKNIEASPKLADDGRTLILEGRIIHKIVKVAPILESENVTTKPFSGLRAAVQDFSSALDKLSRNQNVLKEWQHMAMETSPQYPTAETNREAFEATLTAGIPPQFNPRANHEDWRKNELPRPLLNKVSFNEHPWLFKGATFLQVFQDAASADNRERKQYNTMAYGRRMARTENGYLALVPSKTEVGDWVAVCKGGQTPLILRRRQTAWELIGDSYIHGIMNGESFDPESCQEIRII